MTNVTVKLNGKDDIMVRPERHGEKVELKAGKTVEMEYEQAKKLVKGYSQFEIIEGTDKAKKETKKVEKKEVKKD